ncbi:hypothetical protein [Lactiplantibacillus plantarum]|uniref:hypothetical protein n=1 Tax=Lactiplantibacillus plantarum TaxID=1590 RepID=UPI0021CB105A|nr:hypothetical protein [Lactiplantibacillus plantarum]
MNQNERASRYLKDANLETSGRGKLKIFFGYARWCWQNLFYASRSTGLEAGGPGCHYWIP